MPAPFHRNEKRAGIFPTNLKPTGKCGNCSVSQICHTLFRTLSPHDYLCIFRILVIQIQFGDLFTAQPSPEQNGNNCRISDSNGAAVFYTVLNKRGDFFSEQFSPCWKCLSNNRCQTSRAVVVLSRHQAE